MWWPGMRLAQTYISYTNTLSNIVTMYTFLPRHFNIKDFPLYVNHSSLVPRCSKSWKERLVHTLRMCSYPGFSGELGNFRKIYSVTLTSVLSSRFLRPATDHAPSKRWQESDENAQLFTCKNYSPVCPFQVNTVAREWCNLSLWNSSIALNEMTQAVAVKAITFLT